MATIDRRGLSVEESAPPLVLDSVATSGIVVLTDLIGGVTTRTITGTANQITVTNGDGVVGNPTLSIPSNVALRTKLAASTSIYVNTAIGSDSNDGSANTAAGAFLTIGAALYAVAFNKDLNRQAVQILVQAGTYTENLFLPQWIGYDSAFGFGQIKVLGVGSVTLTSASASPVIFGTRTLAPVTFENITFTNPTALGQLIYMDDYGFVSLKSCTLGATGAGGIKLNSVLLSNILLQASTFEIAGNSGTMVNTQNMSAVTCQPGCVFHASGATTFATAVANVDATSMFVNTGSSFTGTVPTAVPYILEAGGRISDVSLIAGSGSASIGTLGAKDIVATGSVTVGTLLTGTGGILATGDITSTKASGILSETMTASASSVQISYTGLGGMQWYLKDTNAGSDLKYFFMQAVAGSFSIRSLTDVGAAKATFMTFDSSAATVTANSAFIGASSILSTSATAGVGYATGAGGAVTQATNRTTGVTLNKVSGAITLFSQVNTAISQATAQSFTVTNSAVAATDVIIVNQKSGTDKYEIFVTNVSAGSFQITNYAVAGTTNEAPVFNFCVIKGVAS